tara:strand:+ start:34484 stop:34684 length:201 start_codon:yes stop_codon:yes gene_type:complete
MKQLYGINIGEMVLNKIKGMNDVDAMVNALEPIEPEKGELQEVSPTDEEHTTVHACTSNHCDHKLK